MLNPNIKNKSYFSLTSQQIIYEEKNSNLDVSNITEYESDEDGPDPDFIPKYDERQTQFQTKGVNHNSNLNDSRKSNSFGRDSIIEISRRIRSSSNCT